MINFVVSETIYGNFILNRHDIHQYFPIRNTGIPHINDEIKKILDIVITLPENGIFIDGGSNIGLISIPVSKKFKGQVISFEPQTQIYYCLCGTVVLNNLNNITTYNKALGDISSIMWLPEVNYSAARDFGDVVLQNSGKISVDVVTIDSLNLPRLDFLKLDVETMEIAALYGGIETIKKYRPWCWVEYIRVNINDIRKFFDNLGYSLYYADDANIVASPNDIVFPWMNKKV